MTNVSTRLSDADGALYEQAREASTHAYAPYSNFRVGAALRTADGTVVTGANVENASYGLAICAERSACVAAIAQGHTAFDAIAIHVDGPEGAPCGACRQFLVEFGLDLDVIYLAGGEAVHAKLSELLPGAFVPSSLPGR